MDPPSSISVSDSPAALPPPPPPPPTPSHQRRPRVREVSSRFMSPVVSSAVPRRRHHHNNHHHQQQQQPEVDSLNSSDENSRPVENSESTPFPIGSSISHCKGNLGTSTTTTITSTAQRKQRVVKLFKENNSYNGGGGRDPSRSCSGRIGIGIGNGFGGGGGSSRPDTPTVFVVPSRYRFTPHHKVGSSGSGNVSAAAKLLQASGMSLQGNVGSGLSETNSVSGDASSVCSDDECHSDSDVSRSIQSLPELCSDGDVLPTVSNRSVAEKIGNRGALSCSSSSSSSSNSNINGDLKFHASSPLHRSITLPSPGPGGDNVLVHSLKGSEKQTPSMSKLYGNQSNHVKVGAGAGAGLGLPPVPPCAKPVAETRKGNKGSSPQENVHCLRLMYNRYLQWRYANAKAVSAMKVQKRESEKALYSHAMKISEMRDSVSRKRIELELLRRLKAVSTILEAQIPYLDEWSALAEDYSISTTEAIQALVNASVQLPVGGNARVDARELGEALNSALKMMETIVFNIQELMPKAEETEVSISELARVVGGERALIGECGDLMSKTYKSQVEECSLRGQLIQLHSTCHNNKITEQLATDNSIAICEGNEHTLVSS